VFADLQALRRWYGSSGGGPGYDMSRGELGEGPTRGVNKNSPISVVTKSRLLSRTAFAGMRQRTCP